MAAKTGTPSTVDDYIAGFPDDVQAILAQVRAVIKDAVPGAEERISYKMPAYFLHGGLIWFGAYKRHIGMYPMTDGMLAAIDGLAAYKGTKSSLHFPLNQPIPVDLIRQVVLFRVAEHSAKSTSSPISGQSCLT